MEQTNKLANKNELALLFLSFGTFCREAPFKEMCCQINSILAKYHESVIINLGLHEYLTKGFYQQDVSNIDEYYSSKDVEQFPSYQSYYT